MAAVIVIVVMAAAVAVVVEVVATENKSVIANCYTISNYYKRNEHGNSAAHRSKRDKATRVLVARRCVVSVENSTSRLLSPHLTGMTDPEHVGRLFQVEQQIRRARLPDRHGQGYRSESRERRGSGQEDVSLPAEWLGKSIVNGGE